MCSEERKYRNRKCQIIKTDKLGNFNKSNIHKLRMYALNPNCSVIYAVKIFLLFFSLNVKCAKILKTCKHPHSLLIYFLVVWNEFSSPVCLCPECSPAVEESNIFHWNNTQWVGRSLGRTLGWSWPRCRGWSPGLGTAPRGQLWGHLSARR